MENNISGNQQCEHYKDAQIAPVLAGDNLACSDSGKSHKKTDVDGSCDYAADPGRKQNSCAPCKPKKCKSGEWPSVDGEPSGPVRDGCKQKARNCCGDIPVEHLMNVPVERSKIGRQRQLAEILR